jgi:hypothetical protein
MSFHNFERKLKRFGITHWNEEESRKDFPFIVIERDDFGVAKVFCDERFGDDWIWATPMQLDRTTIYFMHESDALIFKLSYPHKPLDAI